MFRYEKSYDLPDIQYAFDSASIHDWIESPNNATSLNFEPLAYYDAFNIRPIVLKPKSRGYILLNNTDPILGRPLIYPGYFNHIQDLEKIVAGK